MSGKGDTPRPLSVDAETWAERYARTFDKVRQEMQQPLIDRTNRVLKDAWPATDPLPTTDPED